MTTPLYDATLATTPSSPLTNMTSRQRLESALTHFAPPPASSASKSLTKNDTTAKAELVKPIQRINEAMRQYGVEFHLNEYDSRVVTRIIDLDSGEVIRQIPSEEVLHIAESIERLQHGSLIRQEA